MTKNRIGLVTLLTITIAFIIFLFYEFKLQHLPSKIK